MGITSSVLQLLMSFKSQTDEILEVCSDSKGVALKPYENILDAFLIII